VPQSFEVTNHTGTNKKDSKLAVEKKKPLIGTLNTGR